jgi:hypothetical protein
MDEKRAEQVLYEVWYSVAETIFEKVCEVTELNQEQIDALRLVALRPNDFHIQVESMDASHEDTGVPCDH